MMGVPIWQPWASLVAVGAKKIETRGKPVPSTILGKRVAIHECLTSRALHKVGEGHFGEKLMDALAAGTLAEVDGRLPLGYLLATAVITDSIVITERFADELRESDPVEWSFGDYSYPRQIGPGRPIGQQRYGWAFADVRRLPAPVSFKGSQGIFRVPDELVGIEPAPQIEQLELGA